MKSSLIIFTSMVTFLLLAYLAIGCGTIEDTFGGKEAQRGACYIEFENKVLVEELRTTEKVDLPGGHSQSGETTAEAAARETEEEANVDIKAPTLLDTAAETDIWVCESVDADLNWEDVSTEIGSIKLMTLAEVKAAEWSLPEVKKKVIEFLSN